MKKRLPKKNSFGFSLVEVLVSAAIAVIFVTIVAGAIVQIHDSLNRRKIAMNRDVTAVLVRKNLSSMSVLRATLKEPVNKTFYDCVCNSGVACNNMASTPLIVYDSPGVPATSFFDSLGFSCLPASPACILQVTYSIAAQCPPATPFPSAKPVPALTCLGPAEFVVISYLVQKNPINTNINMNFKPVSGKFYTLVSELSPVGGGVCP